MKRYVALGDSFTEGIGDPEPTSPGGHRGWADRVAEQLSESQQDFSYANLAIRGRLMQQILDEQLAPALELRPDLISISAGGNDLIRPGSDPDELAETMDTAVASMRATGSRVLLFNGPDVGRTSVLSMVRGKVAIYNENLHTIADKHGAEIANMWSLHELSDPQMWDEDRLHFSPLGHHRIAILALDSLGVKHALEMQSIPPKPPRSWTEARAEDLHWAREHLMPWVIRRIRHESSGDNITAKRPEPGPVGATHGSADS